MSSPETRPVEVTPQATPKSKLTIFFVAAFFLTWLFWVPMGLSERGSVSLPVPTTALVILGGLGPMLAAILLSAYEGGIKEVRSLFGQLKRWRVGRKWYVYAIPAMIVLNVSPVLLHLARGGSVPASELLVQLIILPFFFIFVAILGGGLDEEMGWRGYALPRLQQILPPVPANLLLGILWSCWHLPMWLVPGSSHAESSFAVYLVGTTSLSFIIGWIYNGSGGSLLVAVLAHASSNVADNLRYVATGDPAANPDALLIQISLAGVLVIAAAVIVFATRGMFGTSSSHPDEQEGVLQQEAMVTPKTAT